MMQGEKNAEVLNHLVHAAENLVDRELTDHKKLRLAFQLFEQFFVYISSRESMHFTTLFARIAFVASKYQLSRKLNYQLHRFRKEAVEALDRPGEATGDTASIWRRGLHLTLAAAGRCLGQSVDPGLLARIGATFTSGKDPDTASFIKAAKLLVVGAGKEGENILIAYDERAPEMEIALEYDIPGHNDLYTTNIRQATVKPGFPFSCSVVDVEITKDNTYRPRYIVIDPDYLIDVTSIAYCFDADHAEPYTYLVNKFIPTIPKPPLTLGNIANYFLDVLMQDPQLQFKNVFPQVFKLYPLVFALYSDKEILELQDNARRHFQNLKRVLQKTLPENGIQRRHCYLEPSFYSPTFGIQGRLDVYHFQDSRSDIIELKSGKPFRENHYGLSQPHYVQTLLYDLMIRSVNDFQVKQTNYILYSGQVDKTLRYAPPIDSLQREAIQVRNQLVLLEIQLASLEIDKPGILDTLDPENFPAVKGFKRRDLALFHRAFSGLSEVEKRYIRAFTAFIAREHRLAKMGIHGHHRLNGLASIWLDPADEKEEKFDILQGMQVRSLDKLNEGLVLLQRTSRTNPLANFRSGDIAVFYPDLHDAQSALKSQIYKCSLIRIDDQEVEIRLRSTQVSDADLKKHKNWVLEHDVLDSSFVSMYTALYEFASAPEERRHLILGLQAPVNPDHLETVSLPENIHAHQRALLEQMIRAKDYFLLWGPPGTGKTKVMLRSYVEYTLHHTQDRLLLLAYTNRAVDEICDAIERIDPQIRSQYFRIGSRTATNANYRDQMLQFKSEHMKTRKALVRMLEQHRIVVSTIASILGRQEIFRLLNFHCTVIDEASQVLEPALSKLLTKTKKWILIGDHKQLPAVVIQQPEETAILDPFLSEIKLQDLRESYFERVFRICQENNWHWACGSLHVQGRMHEEIMRFPSKHFYQQELETFKQGTRDLSGPRAWRCPDPRDEVLQVLCSKRLVFIPSAIDPLQRFSKTNDHEARLVVEVVRKIHILMAENLVAATSESIGIMTPFRAQIANIRDKLLNASMDISDLSIDTVERYQGGARDIVILSLCVNDPMYFNSVISRSGDGIDRKLNVAVTRAREQFVLIGNPDMIRLDPLYRALAASCHTLELPLQDWNVNSGSA